MSVHINNQFATKRRSEKVANTVRTVTQEEHADLIDADQRCRLAAHVATIEDSVPFAHQPLWGPGAVLGEWADVCGFVGPPDSQDERQVRLHGARWVLRPKIKSATTTSGCIPLTLARCAIVRRSPNTPGKYTEKNEPHCLTTTHNGGGLTLTKETICVLHRSSIRLVCASTSTWYGSALQRTHQGTSSTT